MNEVNLNFAQEHILPLFQADFRDLILENEHLAVIFNELCFEWIKLQTIHSLIHDLSSKSSQYQGNWNSLIEMQTELGILIRNRENSRVKIRFLYNELVMNLAKLNKSDKRERGSYNIFFDFIKKLKLDIDNDYPASKLEF